MSDPGYDVNIDHMIVHGPLTASRADHMARVREEVERVLREQGVDGLAGGEITMPADHRRDGRSHHRR